MKKILCFAVCISFLAACTSSKNTSTTRSSTTIKQDPNKVLVFEDSDRLSPVLENAQKVNKAVFLVFYADWCAPCKVMEEEVFTQRTTFRYLNKNFLNFHTDYDSEKGALIAGIYEVSSLPTVLFLDPQGIVLERHVGMAQPSDIKRMGDAAKRKMR